MSRHSNSVQNKAETVQYGTAQYISKQCSTDRAVWHSAYSVVQSSVAQCIQCGTVQCSTDRAVWHSACSVVQSSGLESSRLQCSGLESSRLQCSGLESSRVQCSLVQCSGVQCSGVQRSVVLKIPGGVEEGQTPPLPPSSVSCESGGGRGGDRQRTEYFLRAKQYFM